MAAVAAAYAVLLRKVLDSMVAQALHLAVPGVESGDRGGAEISSPKITPHRGSVAIAR